VATILADDGSPLATVSLAEEGNTGVLTIGRISKGKGRLFGYYFAQGKRAVRFNLEILSLPGTLQTSWLGGERQWQIRLASPSGQSRNRQAYSPRGV
jgi:hypothetical protein